MPPTRTVILGPAPGEWNPPGPLPLRLPGEFSYLQIKQRIGRGGMGEVWWAESTRQPDESLVVKFLMIPEFRDHPEHVHQFREEASVGIRLSDKFVVRTYEFLDLRPYMSQGWPPAALVMSRHEPSLHTVLEDLRRTGQKLPPAVVMEFGRNLVEAIQYLHAEGFVHRDIKPGNVLLKLKRANGDSETLYSGPDSLSGATALLSDFGVLCKAGTFPRFLLGQDGWKAPELFEPGTQAPRTDRLADPSEDIYALGRVFQAMAEFVPEPQDWLSQVIQDCLNPDPSKRPPASQQLALRLSPDWLLQDFMVRGGWKPEAHPHFTGRQFVFDAFDAFRKSRHDRGGLFLIEGEAGVGKTALLTQWAKKGALHPAFFFRQAEGRVSAYTMLGTLFQALCKQYKLEESLPDSVARHKDALENLLRRIAQEKLGAGDSLLLLIDGLDESEDHGHVKVSGGVTIAPVGE